MTPEEFLQSLLISQNLSPQQEKDLQSHKKEVTDFLRAEFGTTPVIKYAGSWKKGTMISNKYDLDIVCYFPSSDERSLKEIREDVTNHLVKNYLIKHKSSAERILDLKGSDAPIDFHIDVVPGRFIENSKDVFLHVSNGDKERMQTNLKTHIDYIVNSGCVPIIRLVKLWALRNDVKTKTFVLELFVIKSLADWRNKGNLQQSFIKVLEAFKDQFEKMQLVDPANTNNNVSALVDPTDKVLVKNAATIAFNTVNDSKVITDWQNIFREGSKVASGVIASALAAVAYAPGASFTPTRPWRDNHDNGN